MSKVDDDRGHPEPCPGCGRQDCVCVEDDPATLVAGVESPAPPTPAPPTSRLFIEIHGWGTIEVMGAGWFVEMIWEYLPCKIRDGIRKGLRTGRGRVEMGPAAGPGPEGE